MALEFLSGRTVFRCWVGNWSFGLQFAENDNVFIRIEHPFQLTHAGKAILVERGDLEGLGLATILAGQTVTEATILQNGTLQIIFRGGDQILVPPDQMYEAWTIEGPGRHLVVCMPGGEIATWE